MYTVCAISEMIIYPLFAMVSMMRITEVEISKKSKYAEHPQLENFEITVNVICTVCAISETII